MPDQGSAGANAVQLPLPGQQAVRQRFGPYRQLGAAATAIPKKQQMGVQQPATVS
ncbi:hypothetical protein [uncultured Azohydromonas sp.]|jgi:hypothetical protein|uniref:hypothetical protein n=1 Tax=uncultured Azohydromonas sp. TaxID=487342 RepID=UPI0026185762|nr:hypothetical protein [uncultured Azohydromonas sp.]